jgi:imidazolonepropionase-like amidohydrolase
MKTIRPQLIVLKYFISLTITVLYFHGRLIAQVTQPQNGVREHTPSVHAFLHTTLVVSPDLVINDATLLIREGRIEAAGAGVKVPADAVIHDCKGKWIFPGFIDPWSEFGMPEFPKTDDRGNGAPIYDNTKPGSHSWNQAVKPETRADAIFKADEKQADMLRKAGYTTVNAVPRDGVFRGTSSIVNLKEGSNNEMIASSRSSLCLSFAKGSSPQQYPASLMGTIALIRQTMYDAQWYAAVMKQPAGSGNEKNLSLEALNAALNDKLPLLFDAGEHLDLLRAMKIATEFNLNFIYRSTGEDYLVADELKKQNAKLILPLTFPKAWDLKDPADEREVSLTQMSHWENAPWNAYHLQGLTYAFSPTGLKSADEVMDGIRKVTDCGLKMKGTLEALTRKPAELLGIEKQAGTLDPGKWANFIICSGNIFEYTNAEIMETWVGGKSFSQVNNVQTDPRGMYEGTANGAPIKLKIAGKLSKPTAKIVEGTDSAEVEIELSIHQISFNYKVKGSLKRFRGIVSGNDWEGSGENADGSIFTWKVSRITSTFDPTTDPDAKVSKTEKTPPVLFQFQSL